MNLMEIEYMKAGRLQSEKVIINSHGEEANQIHNPNAQADYANYLANYKAKQAEKEAKNEK